LTIKSKVYKYKLLVFSNMVMNKRGADSSPGGAITGIVIAIAVLVILIIVLVKFFAPVRNFFDSFGAQALEVKVQTCVQASKSNYIASYCDTPTETNLFGKNQYVTCRNPAIQRNVEALAAPSFECTTSIGLVARQQCVNLVKSGKADDETMVEDKLCTEWITCSTLGGQYKTPAECRAVKGSKSYNEGFQQTGTSGSICCVTPDSSARTEELLTTDNSNKVAGEEEVRAQAQSGN